MRSSKMGGLTPVPRSNAGRRDTKPMACKTKRCTPEEIAQELAKLGIKGENTMMQNTLIKEDLEKYLDEGLSCDEIANTTGLTVGTIKGKAKRYGLLTAMLLNDKPKQQETITPIPQNRAEEPKKQSSTQAYALKDKNRTSEASEKITAKSEEGKPRKITLDNLDEAIVSAAQQLEDLKTTKMVLQRMAEGSNLEFIA
jgi:hypothetical protein